MAALGDIIKINDADYAGLKAAGSAGYVINGVRYYYDPNNIYLTPNNAGNVIELTWAALKSLRDSSQLIPGTYYRITDYELSVPSEISTSGVAKIATFSSGNHSFDIIVKADTSNVVNEEAKAIQHAGDTYFSKSRLEAWKIWYCLDNDITRFTWAKIAEIIAPNVSAASFQELYRYPRLDKIGDAHPYAWVPKDTQATSTSTLNKPVYTNSESPTTSDKVYTTSTGSTTFTIKYVNIQTSGKGVIYRMIDEFNNDVPYDFKNVRFIPIGTSGYIPSSITYTFSYNNGTVDGSVILGSSAGTCCNNHIEPYFSMDNLQSLNNIGLTSNSSSSILMENNHFKAGCHDIWSSSNIENITCESECRYIFFNGTNSGHFFGNNCNYIILGNTSYNNYFEIGSNNITLGNYSSFNHFGMQCAYISAGTYFVNNTIGNNCVRIMFVTSTSSDTLINYCQYNTIQNNCRYLKIYSDDTSASSSNYLQHLLIKEGTNFNSSTYRYVRVYDRNRSANYTDTIYSAVPSTGVKNLDTHYRFSDYDLIRITLKGADLSNSASWVALVVSPYQFSTINNSDSNRLYLSNGSTYWTDLYYTSDTQFNVPRGNVPYLMIEGIKTR